MENKPVFGYLLLAAFLISLLVNFVAGIKTVAEVFDYFKAKPDNRIFFTAVITNTTTGGVGINPNCEYSLRQVTPDSERFVVGEISRLLPTDKTEGYQVAPAGSGQYRFLISNQFKELIELGAVHISVKVWQSNGIATVVSGPFKRDTSMVIPLRSS